MFALRFFKTALAAMALASLAACATNFRADVSRFQQLPAPQGQSFAVAATEGNDGNSLEFAHYADLVRAKLEAYGYRPVAQGQTADFTVKLHYGVDSGRERIVRDPGFYDPFWGPGWGWGYRRGFYGYGAPVIVHTRAGYRYAFGLYDPFLFGPGFGDYGSVSSYTVYTSGLDMTIERNGTGERLFEGSAEAVSRSNDLTQLVPNLIEAMFTNFPGNSGEKVRITVAPPEGQRR